MKTILSSRRDRYLARFSIFLITVALIAGMVGCEPTECNLKIISKAGGSVTATFNEQETVINQGEEDTIFGIANSTEVNLVATPDDGWRFVNWTGDVDDIADVEDAKTTIIMNDDYSITANFVQGQEIWNWTGLDAIRYDLGGDHILMKDLDSNMDDYKDLASPTANGGDGWEPIVTFTGTFDGQGYEIRGLSINRTTENYMGLFGAVGRGGVVQNVTVVNANVTGVDYVGGLVGKNWGTVSDSYSTGSVTGSNQYVGGLVGWNGGDVLDSHSSGNVNGSNQYVGGLVGWNEGTVSDSHSSSNVNGSNDYVGGLTGLNQGTVTNSYFTGSVSGGSWVGGLAGNNLGTVENSHSSGNVTGSNMYVGGLVGYNKGGTVSSSNSTSNVTGRDEHVGGLVGWNEGTVSSSNSTGNVKGNDKVGGLVGFNNYGGIVSKSYSTGNVIGEEGSDIGGLVGWNEGKVEDSYSSSGVSGRLGVGGLVGKNVDTVERSYYMGNVTGKDYVGGLVGENRGTVSNSISTGSVSGHKYVGGLVGENDDIVESSYSTGNVTGEDHVGGLVGFNNYGGTVSKSYSTGSVTGSSRSTHVGGLVGYNEQSFVGNSYSTGNVSGYKYVGGLVGYNEQGTVENSYSIGTVNGTYGDGGLVGRDNWGDVRNCFWDKDTSGIEVSAEGTGKNTTAMKNIDTYTKKEPDVLDEPWDITDVPPNYLDDAYTWNIVNGVTYPFLSWES